MDKEASEVVQEEIRANRAIQTKLRGIPEAVPGKIALEPKEAIDKANEIARYMKQIIDKKEDKVMINGKQYLEFEDWQLLGAPYGITAKVVETKPSLEYMLKATEPVKVFWAKAVALRNGVEISGAEAICSRDEQNWHSRDNYAVFSMAQTRACAKALRMHLSWIAVLGGFAATPAEEMGFVPPQPWRVMATRYPGKCQTCGKELKKGDMIAFNGEIKPKGVRCLVEDHFTEEPKETPNAR